jgi:colanic acid/amylovoran biosynthesis protein
MLSRIRLLERYLGRHWPSLAERILEPRLTWLGNGDRDLRCFLDAVATADLVVVVGMGGITDAFPEFASDLLHTLELAMECGALTVMVGQGIGPLKDPTLLALAEAVLPRVDFISLREERAGGPLLRTLGVSPDRVMTTGDDAIELAYQLRSKGLGDGLGISLRAAPYSGVGYGLIEQLRPILQGAAKICKAPMIPVPVSRHPDEKDAVVIQELVQGYSDLPDAGQDLDTWQKVIEQAGRCRVVVAGSYHAGVFALSQGIPVVGLAVSDYYVDKFLGLADQFGIGCEVIFLRDTQWPEKLAAAIDRAWQSAEQVRPRLLEAAVRQVEQSQAAYQRIYSLVLSHQTQRQKVNGTAQ